MEAFRPQLRDRELTHNPHRIELRGSPRQLAWPSLCPACGAAASDRVQVAKVFTRRSRRRRRGERFGVIRVTIPYCASCAARHRMESPPMSPAARAFSYVRSPLLITMVCAAAFAVVIAPRVYAAPLPTPTSPDEVNILRFARQLPLFLAVLAVGSLVGMLYQTRRYRVPAQTHVTRACDFSDDLSQFWEREFHVWTVRDPAFFCAFTEANRDRVVTGEQRATRGAIRAVVFVLLVLAALGISAARWAGML